VKSASHGSTLVFFTYLNKKAETGRREWHVPVSGRLDAGQGSLR
jgi:hypothetical protein